VYEGPRVTPSCRHFAFFHQDELDPDPDYDVLLLSLDALDILPFGQSAVDVDVTMPPPSGTRAITTSLKDFQQDFCSAHQAMAMDQCMNEDLIVPYHWLYCTAGTPTDDCP
jgi:hypothetical protein